MKCVLALLSLGLVVNLGVAKEKTPAERGRDALFEQCFVPPVVSFGDYGNLWRVWGVKRKPVDLNRLVRERYGLHETPYPNKGLPMGLRESKGPFFRGIGTDCLMCHASTIAGKTVMGLGNSSLDLQAFFDDISRVQGVPISALLQFSNVRGTTESSASAAYLFQFRNPDLTLRPPKKIDFTTTACEDVPAWWLLKKKTTMYATGSHSSRAVRPLMAFLLNPLNSADYVKKHEGTFRDIQAYMLSLEAPRYPFAVDRKKADVGRRLFEMSCARCHGMDDKYPNKVIDLDTIGTDPVLATGFPAEAEEVFNKSWFGEEKQAKGQRGYQAPPLDGVWATAPYFHNGSVPTLYHVLNSKARPKLFTRSYLTEEEDYDKERVGWKFTTLDKPAGTDVPTIERRKEYDTTKPGRANTGHTFGDKLTDAERWAIIEYLKTL